MVIEMSIDDTVRKPANNKGLVKAVGIGGAVTLLLAGIGGVIYATFHPHDYQPPPPPTGNVLVDPSLTAVPDAGLPEYATMGASPSPAQPRYTQTRRATLGASGPSRTPTKAEPTGTPVPIFSTAIYSDSGRLFLTTYEYDLATYMNIVAETNPTFFEGWKQADLSAVLEQVLADYSAQLQQTYGLVDPVLHAVSGGLPYLEVTSDGTTTRYYPFVAHRALALGNAYDDPLFSSISGEYAGYAPSGVPLQIMLTPSSLQSTVKAALPGR